MRFGRGAQEPRTRLRVSDFGIGLNVHFFIFLFFRKSVRRVSAAGRQASAKGGSGVGRALLEHLCRSPRFHHILWPKGKTGNESSSLFVINWIRAWTGASTVVTG